MLEIIETKTKTIEVKKYKAVDGTIFEDAENCAKYEKTAAVVILERLMKISLGNPENITSMASKIFDWDDCDYYLLKPTTQVDIDNLNQLYLLFGGSGTDKVKFTYDQIGELIMMCKRMDSTGIDWIWFIELSKFIYQATEGECVVS